MRKKQKISKVKRIGTCLVACIMIAAMTITSVPLFQTEVRAAGVSNPWDGSSREVPETDEDGTYLIHNGAQLACLQIRSTAEMVRSTRDWKIIFI